MIDRLTDKFDLLLEKLPQHSAVAFSAGVDSTFLLKAASMAGDTVALTVDTAFLPRKEMAEAEALAAKIGAPLEVIRMDVLSDPRIAGNGANRCYHCKSRLFTALSERARALERTLMDGSNADDVTDYRPGMRALRELAVQSPLLEMGWTKAEIRQMSGRLGLETADKPALACLATRLPMDTPIDSDALRRIERGEDALHAMGFLDMRLRGHGDLARLELLPPDMERALGERGEITRILRSIGYRYIALDLDGKRMGSMNTPDVRDEG